jgi:release factor glutamine methyltransferase
VTEIKQWTTRGLLAWMTERFEENQIESPRLISEMLLTHILGGQRIDLYANADRKATEEERETLRALVKRALAHEPVQYIVGKTWFNGLEFNVNSSTLIPRSCTERLIDQCLHHANELVAHSPVRVADIGTGTGCIAISIAKHASNCELTATDISAEALALATENASIHSVDSRIEFICGDGLEPLTNLEPFDIICSNPPYIPDNEMLQLDANVREWEPDLALRGGSDGLQIITPLVENAPKLLANDGLLILEIASSTSRLVLEMARSIDGLRDVSILRDTFGDDRFLRAKKA